MKFFILCATISEHAFMTMADVNSVNSQVETHRVTLNASYRWQLACSHD